MKKNILLVDDDKIFNFLTEKTISSLGLVNEIHFALNGEEALDLLELYKNGELAKPDIIFVDLSMPIMDGFEFIEAFRDSDIPEKESITLVVLTSSADPMDINRAKELGIKYYFNKPLSKEEVKKMVGQEFSFPLN